jgi:hypothetical protein
MTQDGKTTVTADPPPRTKYELTLVIHGNSHEEIERELLGMTRGGYLLDSEYGSRDEFHVTGSRRTSVLKHTNPDMTPERYDADLDTWWQRRKTARQAPGSLEYAQQQADTAGDLDDETEEETR